MAFVNEKLTPEQQVEFNSWGIEKPLLCMGRVMREVEMGRAYNWTVDKERNIYLLEVAQDREYPNEIVFVFIWNNKNYIVQFYRSFEDDDTVVWNIPEKYLIDHVFPYCTEEHFLDDLRDALLVFQAFGEPNDLNEKGNTKCNF